MRNADPVVDVAEEVRGGGRVVLAVLMPHAPVLVPSVGGRRLGEVASTVRAMREVAHRVRDAEPDSVVLVSPHSPRQREAFGIWQGGHIHGALVQFGAGAADSEIDLPVDGELRDEIKACGAAAGVPTWAISGPPLDHGAVVPLWFLQEAGWAGPTVLLSLNDPDAGMLEELGAAIAQAGAHLGRRIAFVASGDMSHRLQPGAPAGYHPDAWRSDEQFIELLRAGDGAGLRRLDPAALEAAAEDAVDSTRIAFASVKNDPRGHDVLSYEGPFGVGYGVAILHDSTVHPGPGAGQVLPALARRSLEAWFSGSDVPVPRPAGDYFRQKRGVFVTIRERSGALRGCMGSLEGAADDVVAETWRVARSAALGDRRFPPLRADELPGVAFEVSVLHAPEPVASPDALDPERFGIMVRTPDGRSGVLLPGIPSIDSVAEQIAIARRKGAIAPHEPVAMERFEIEKFSEEETS